MKAKLLATGWRKVGESKPGKYGSAHLWDHPQHQPDNRGCFTTTEAYLHQKNYEKYGTCNCIKPECCGYSA